MKLRRNNNTWMSPVSAIILAMGTTACEVPTEDLMDALNHPESDYDGAGPGVAPRCFVERYQQPEAEITTKLDLLFVADTSGSLDAERAAVADGIDAFVQVLPSNVDFRIGVLLAHGDQSSWNGRLFKASNSVHVIDSKVHTMSQVRSYLRKNLTNVADDLATDGGEAMLYATTRMFQADRFAEAQGRGFFRADAALAVAYITDEQDICYTYPAGVTPVRDTERREGPAKTRLCSGITSASVHQLVKDAKGDMPYLFGGVLYYDPATYVANGENEIGYGILELIQGSSGVLIDIASGNYVNGLTQMGQMATMKLELLNSFTLARTNIDPATIEAWVDGLDVDHAYAETTNEVTISNPGIAKSIVDLRYCLKPENTGGNGSGGPTCGGVDCGGVIGI